MAGAWAAESRLAFLDGLRGVAIGEVVLWHCYGPQFANYLPFGSRYADLYPVQYGWMGVQLFFMISGFVILMTLDRCAGLLDFAKRRWLRLFPAMFFGSLLILAFDVLANVGPYADRGLINLIPGWLFISPPLIHTITRASIESMDGPFWSLYVEVSFYVIFGSVYFLLGSRSALVIIFILFAASVSANFAAASGVGGELFARIAAAADWVGLIWFGWFASGSLFYLSRKNNDRKLFVSAVVVGAISALTYSSALDGVRLLSVVALFSLALISSSLQGALEWRGLTALGFISYPLYLIHNNISIGTTEVLARSFPPELYFLAPILPIAGVSIAAWLIAQYVEPAIRRIVKWLVMTRRLA